MTEYCPRKNANVFVRCIVIHSSAIKRCYDGINRKLMERSFKIHMGIFVMSLLHCMAFVLLENWQGSKNIDGAKTKLKRKL